MNRSPRKDTVPLPQRPARLAVGLLGAALLLLGGVPLAERFQAHLTLWGAALPIPGLPHLVLFAAGVAALSLFWRRRHGTAGRPDPKER
ncbi:hypothetical protein [Streptomyces sp. NPDC002133]|uniref:hypothetical protein n=1 Tax=Streptomyces sp. NPDC002133 TaxID=3154409 RepID=UPI00332A2DA6